MTFGLKNSFLKEDLCLSLVRASDQAGTDSPDSSNGLFTMQERNVLNLSLADLSQCLIPNILTWMCPMKKLTKTVTISRRGGLHQRAVGTIDCMLLESNTTCIFIALESENKVVMCVS